jgi:predicted esterase
MASPAGHITKDDPPLIILAGGADGEEPKIQGQSLQKKYKAAGLNATFQIVEGAGHGGPQYRDEKRRKLILDLFSKQLRGKSTD